MKLGTLRDGSRDGCLLVVSRDLKYAVRAAGIAPTLLGALESWETAAPELHKLSALLNTGAVAGAFELDVRQLAAPLPRTWAWLDGSAFHSHEIVERSDNPGGSCTTMAIVDLVNSTLHWCMGLPPNRRAEQCAVQSGAFATWED